jgi:hypothetical protein
MQPVARSPWPSVRNTPFLRHMLKIIPLPRQARDKHRERKLNKRCVFLKGTAEQAILRTHDLYINPGQPANHLEWGYLHLTVPSASSQNATTWMGASNVARGHFARDGSLPAADNMRFPEPVCGASGQFTLGPAVCGCDDGTADSTATNWPTLVASFTLGVKKRLLCAIFTLKLII